MSEYPIGARVELHPATDEWMQGDRYGEIVGRGRRREYRDRSTVTASFERLVVVKLDRSGRTRRFHPENVTVI
jgi:hypothetical protein